MNLFEALRPWTDVIFEQVPELELFDAHTHLGSNDPDGMKQTPEELVLPPPEESVAATVETDGTEPVGQ